MELRLQNLLKASEQNTGEAFELASITNKLSRISLPQKVANQSLIQDYVPKIIYNLVSNVSNIDPSNLQTISQYASILRALKNFVPQNMIDQTYITQLNNSLADLEGKAKQQALEDIQKTADQRLANIVMENGVNAKLQITSVVKPLRIPVGDESASGIQGNIATISDIVNNPPVTGLIDPSNLPPTMKLLSRYAEQLGYTGLGTITGRKGRVYVGVQQVQQDGIKVMKGFPSQKTYSNTVSTISDIKTTFRNYAGKTIDAWNNYVQAEESFVNFANQISTQEKREQYVKKQIKGMSTLMFEAQSLSVLTFYYVYVPITFQLKKMKQKSQQIKEFSWKNFYDNYSLPPGISWNPFSLSYQSIKKLLLLLLSTKQDGTRQDYQTIKEVMSKAKAIYNEAILPQGKANAKNMDLFELQRTLQSKSYLASLGIGADQTGKILKTQSLDQLIFVKVVYPSQYQNSQMSTLINSAISTENTKWKSSKWELSWLDDRIPAYDYIWGKKY